MLAIHRRDWLAVDRFPSFVQTRPGFFPARLVSAYVSRSS